MKLIDLEPQFLNALEDPTRSKQVDTIGEANGIMFLCPKCFAEKGNNRGVHSIICWDPTVSLDRTPSPGRWKMEGTSYDNLTLIAGSSSVLLNGGCNAHFFVRNGEIIMT